MDAVYGWVRNLVCFYIFMTAVLHLLPKESYRKYIRFFTGLLLVILVLTPVFSLFRDENVLYEKIAQAGFWQDTENIKLDTEYLEDSQRAIYQKEYEKAIGVDISQMAESQELETREVEVQLDHDYQVKQISLKVSFSDGEGAGVEKAFFAGEEEYPAVRQLKKNLSEFYGIAESQIEVAVRGG